MLRRLVRTCLLLTLPAMGCQKPPATEPTIAPGTEPADAATTNADEPEQPLPPAEEILAKSLDAIGGQAAIEAITSSYKESKAEVKAQGITLTVYEWTKGDKLYSEADLAGMGKQQQWRNGDDIWSKDPVFGFRKLEGKEAAQARWLLEGPMIAAHWNKYFKTVETTGRSTEGDSSRLEVTMTSADGETLVMKFDEKTYLLLEMAFDQVSPMGAIPVRSKNDDFRDVGDIKMPYHSIMEVQLQTMETTTQKYEVNVEIPDSKFEPPAEAKAKAKTK